MIDDEGGRREADRVIIRLEERVSDLIIMMHEVKTAVMGDGTRVNPGIMIRLDRLEQSEEKRMAHRTVLYTAIVGLVIERVWHYVELLRGLGGHG